MKRFSQYVRMREEDLSSQPDSDIPPEQEKSTPDTLNTAMKIACNKHRSRTKQFLKELNDPDIEKVLSQLEDDVDDEFTGPIRKSEKDNKRDDNMVMIPKADGNPGADGGGWEG